MATDLKIPKLLRIALPAFDAFQNLIFVEVHPWGDFNLWRKDFKPSPLVNGGCRNPEEFSHL